KRPTHLSNGPGLGFGALPAKSEVHYSRVRQQLANQSWKCAVYADACTCNERIPKNQNFCCLGQGHPIRKSVVVRFFNAFIVVGGNQSSKMWRSEKSDIWIWNGMKFSSVDK